jgi:hypothetical protein
MNMRLAHLLAVAAIAATSRGGARADDDWPVALGLQANAPILVLPAAAGSIVDLQQRLTSDRLTQTITFQGDPLTPGQNVLVTSVLRGGLAPAAASEEIDSEMEDRLPGIAMNVSPYPGRNVFGVFDYALGAKGPVACIYAWQGMTNADIWIDGRAAGIFDEHHALSMRIRLCRTGMGPSALVGLAQDLTRAAMTRMRMANRGACYGLFSNFGGCCLQSYPVAMAAPEEPNYAPPAAMRIARPPAPVRMAASRPLHSRKAAQAVDVKSIRRAPEPAKPLEGMPTVPMPQ